MDINYLIDDNAIKKSAMKIANKCHFSNNEHNLETIIDVINNVEIPQTNNNRYKLIVTLIKSILIEKIGIIYCLHISECYSLAYFLKVCGIYNVSVYCSETPLAEKNELLHFWQQTKSAFIIIATNAFGMGIDKNCVSFVIQYNLFGSMSEYVQQCGRAGRDGQKALCLQLFSYNDYDR